MTANTGGTSVAVGVEAATPAEDVPISQNELFTGTAEALAKLVRGRHPGVTQIICYFAWAHLPERLQMISRPIGLQAMEMCQRLPDSPELVAGLRKLLEAKDCFVRAAL